MDTPHATLIKRLRERAFDPDRATDLGQDVCDRKGRIIPYIARPPVSETELADAEAYLGFRLPALLRDIYLRVGNGGLGPGYGLNRLSGGTASNGGESVVAMYLSQRASTLNPSQSPSTERLLPICDWGCAIYSSVDCALPDAPVVRHDPNIEIEVDEEHRGEFTSEVRIQQGALWVECSSLQAWLEAWLDGRELFYSAYHGSGTK
jgi:hypothetical protein